jgi:hypothetical protein
MIHTAVDGNAPHQHEGDYSSRLHCTTAHELDAGYVGICFMVVHRSVD